MIYREDALAALENIFGEDHRSGSKCRSWSLDELCPDCERSSDDAYKTVEAALNQLPSKPAPTGGI